MNRNVAIVIIILVVVVIAGYLIWLRSKVQPPVSPQITEEEVVVSPSPEVTPSPSATPFATPGAKEATGSVKQKTSTPGGTAR
ncbi:MAG: hypothetical protein AAB414_03525 [Patescibacteria group bacterium]